MPMTLANATLQDAGRASAKAFIEENGNPISQAAQAMREDSMTGGDVEGGKKGYCSTSDDGQPGQPLSFAT